jgi:hypothetical protein
MIDLFRSSHQSLCLAQLDCGKPPNDIGVSPLKWYFIATVSAALQQSL